MCSSYSTGLAEGDRQAGSVAAECSERGRPSGCAGAVRDPVEILPAPPAAQSQETHQDTPAQSGSSTGRHTEVKLFSLYKSFWRKRRSADINLLLMDLFINDV